MPGVVEPGDNKKMVAAVSAADEIIILAAGGGGTFSACIAPWAASSRIANPVTRAIVAAGSK